MKKWILSSFFLLLVTVAQAWGFWAHQRINRMAVYTLPPEMLGLYKQHLTYLTEHAVDPDKRRYAVEGEAYRHYIDIDHWGEKPFEVVPRRWGDVLVRYASVYGLTHGGDTLHLGGGEALVAHGDSLWWKSAELLRVTGRDSLLLDQDRYRSMALSLFSPYETSYQYVLPLDSLQALFPGMFWEENLKSCLVIDKFTPYGILPYHLPREVNRLTRAFQAKDLDRILRISADLGHYVGDAHVPLHTTENYNGQFTGQRGIHGFWESRLPELFAESYDYYIGRAYYVENVSDEVWQAVTESHMALDSVLRFEKELSASFPSDKKYGYESRNNVVVRTYSYEFSKAYHDRLNGQVERRLRMSIKRLGALWYTAWKNAGSPDLSDLMEEEVEEEKKQYEPKLKIEDREASGVGGVYDRLDNLKMCPGEPHMRQVGMEVCRWKRRQLAAYPLSVKAELKSLRTCLGEKRFHF
jgi:hypothetical protein